MATSKLAHTTVTPRKGKVGKLQLQESCDLKTILKIIEKLGFVPATHEDLTRDIATGNNNIVVAVGSKVKCPRRGIDAHVAYLSGKPFPLHLPAGEIFTAFMEIAIKEKAA